MFLLIKILESMSLKTLHPLEHLTIDFTTL